MKAMKMASYANIMRIKSTSNKPAALLFYGQSLFRRKTEVSGLIVVESWVFIRKKRQFWLCDEICKVLAGILQKTLLSATLTNKTAFF